MTSRKPLLSVAMPVRNARQFLEESISSILNQTFTDFEFVLFDDGSSDGSSELLEQWAKQDSRIRAYHSSKGLGLSRGSNFVMAKCRAPLIARMDADDVSHPDRLRRQYALLNDRSDIAVVGTLCDGIDARGRMVRPRDRWRIVRRSSYMPFPHGSAMMRREAFVAVGGYSEAAEGGEDQDLFFRMTTQGKVVTLPDVLYRYRYHLDNSTLHNGQKELGNGHLADGNELMALYRLGAMRLWAGEAPMILEPLLARKPLQLNIATVITLASATWGSVSPATLRFFLRSLLRTRDLLASFRVKDGTPYEWRLE